MEEIEKLTGSVQGRAAAIIMVQAVTVLLILLSVLTMKYFFPEYYGEVRKWYETEFCSETSVDEVLKASGGDTDEV